MGEESVAKSDRQDGGSAAESIKRWTINRKTAKSKKKKKQKQQKQNKNKIKRKDKDG